MDANEQKRINTALSQALAPPDNRQIWDWAADHIESIPYSPMPGRFRVENSPWLKEVFREIKNTDTRLISIIAAVQTGKTTAPEVALCYIIANEPGPTLWLDQTDDDAKDQSESRLQKLFAECKPVRNLFPSNRHKMKNATIHFANGMTLWFAGAHNKTNLQRKSIRWLICDETWRYPQGHLAEAEARVTAFGWLGKCILMSQGSEAGDDTTRKFESTDMREWTFACPECGHRQPFLWENVEWSKDAKGDDGEWDFNRVRETTSLRCVKCNHYFEDSDDTRRRLNATGEYVAQNPRALKGNVGFHWNALCSMAWGQLAEMYLRAKFAMRQADESLMRAFYQKRLAVPWQEFSDDFKMEVSKSGYKKGDVWDREAGVLPSGKIVPSYDPQTTTPLRVLTVDVQRDHMFCVVRSFAADGSSRLFWNEKIHTFDDLKVIQERFKIHRRLVFVDCGYQPFYVYQACAVNGWTAARGDFRSSWAHKVDGGKTVFRVYSPAQPVDAGNGRSCRMHYWSNLNVKDILARLRRNQDASLGATWEVPDDIDEDYLIQMESERRVKTKTGWRWQNIGAKPNHFWDCEAMAIAAACMLKLVGGESVKENREDENENENK